MATTQVETQIRLTIQTSHYGVALHSREAGQALALKAKLRAGLLTDPTVVTRVDVAGWAGADADPGSQLAAQVDLLTVDDELTDASWD